MIINQPKTRAFLYWSLPVLKILNQQSDFYVIIIFIFSVHWKSLNLVKIQSCFSEKRLNKPSLISCPFSVLLLWFSWESQQFQIIFQQIREKLFSAYTKENFFSVSSYWKETHPYWHDKTTGLALAFSHINNLLGKFFIL